MSVLKMKKQKCIRLKWLNLIECKIFSWAPWIPKCDISTRPSYRFVFGEPNDFSIEKPHTWPNFSFEQFCLLFKFNSLTFFRWFLMNNWNSMYTAIKIDTQRLWKTMTKKTIDCKLETSRRILWTAEDRTETSTKPLLLCSVLLTKKSKEGISVIPSVVVFFSNAIVQRCLFSLVKQIAAACTQQTHNKKEHT